MTRQKSQTYHWPKLYRISARLIGGPIFANPASAPGAGDATDVANGQLVGVLGIDVPAPSLGGGVAQGDGVLNHFTLAEVIDPSNPVSHAVFSNPACGAHIH